MSAKRILPLVSGAFLVAASIFPLTAGLHLASVTPGNLPWPGGIVPYVMDSSTSATQQETYLDGLREWELAANVIHGNRGNGIIFFDNDTVGQSIRRNSIFENGNDALELGGSNHGQLAPALGTAVLGLGTTVTGTLQGSPVADYTVELFASPDVADRGGRNFSGSVAVTMDGGGMATINADLPAIVKAG